MFNLNDHEWPLPGQPIVYKGIPGEMGPAGEPGPSGNIGSPGPRGTPGASGGKEEIGIPGTTGAKGPMGEPGEKGEVGQFGQPVEPGKAGNTGPHGIPGVKGLRGDRGNQGIPGQDEAPGRPGPQGQPGSSGAITPSGAPGVDGIKRNNSTGRMTTLNEPARDDGKMVDVFKNRGADQFVPNPQLPMPNLASLQKKSSADGQNSVTSLRKIPINKTSGKEFQSQDQDPFQPYVDLDSKDKTNEILASQDGFKDLNSKKTRETKNGKTMPLAFEDGDTYIVSINESKKQGRYKHVNYGNWLKPADLRKIKETNDENKQSTGPVYYSVQNVCLESTDLDTLKPMGWLNNWVLNAILSKFMHQYNGANRGKISVYPCYLDSRNSGDLPYKEKTFTDHVWQFIPILVDWCHWVLLAVDVAEDEISILDSLSDHVDKKGIEKWGKLCFGDDVRKMKIGVRKSAQQNDNSSCGLFVIMNVIILTMGGNPEDFILDPNKTREEIYEILIGLAQKRTFSKKDLHKLD